ncbi:MAG TPA: hypothetical protein VGZ27_14620 [Vicinamibacterales bacterium]|nr:hypothetical protein [Vicinamibacterales bacterium]
MEQTDRPANGDVLITKEGGRYLLSIVPHPHKLTLGALAPAVAIAMKWAAANHATAWQVIDGVTTPLPAKKPTKPTVIE